METLKKKLFKTKYSLEGEIVGESRVTLVGLLAYCQLLKCSTTTLSLLLIFYTGSFSKDFFSQGAVKQVFLGLFHKFFY